MCGIVGFTGNRQAAPILLDGLSKLEYRGYDSAGLAVRDGENLAQVVKAKGRLSNLIEKTDGGKALKGTCGIGHTRWATHGEPSQTNAHPHVSGNCTRSGSGTVESEVVGVHNGIIENYTELKEKLLKHGYTFYSQTDTEVVIKLVDYYYKKYNLGPIDAIAKTMVRVRGSYALELMFRDYPGEIWVARKDSPMIIGIADGETYVASDVPAILKSSSRKSPGERASTAARSALPSAGGCGICAAAMMTFFKQSEGVPMQTINLKQYYPFCKEDIFVEVSDEIVEAFLLDKRAEAARERKMFRYKAFYSLDCNDGIENAAIGWAQPSPEDHLIEKEELAEYEELIRRLYEAISSLPPMQARRVHARYMLGMKVKDIAAMEGITPSQAGKSIHAALRRLRRYFARQKWTVNL